MLGILFALRFSNVALSAYRRCVFYVGIKMARVTIEDCLENVENRFKLVLLASQRARQLQNGADEFVKRGKDKDTVVALREIAAGHVTPDNIDMLHQVGHHAAHSTFKF
jgi:DNA-directed RNA polymerase subunit omega